jgi:dTDP-glucose 4,6-dehydratase
MSERPILVTGGAGFIGSALVRRLVLSGERVVNVDKLTYAGNLDSLAPVAARPEHVFEQVDIADGDVVRRVFAVHRPRAVLHLAAESHVDRSIDGPQPFVQTNVVGTLQLLQAARGHWESLPPAEREAFRFVHVSTDEVFGSLGTTGRFTEESPYQPRSPIPRARRARPPGARGGTYGPPVIVTTARTTSARTSFPRLIR